MARAPSPGARRGRPARPSVLPGSHLPRGGIRSPPLPPPGSRPRESNAMPGVGAWAIPERPTQYSGAGSSRLSRGIFSPLSSMATMVTMARVTGTNSIFCWRRWAQTSTRTVTLVLPVRTVEV